MRFLKMAFAVGLCAFLFVFCKTDNKTIEKPAFSPALRLPAEFEKQAAVWLFWPQNDHVSGLKNADVLLEIARQLAPFVAVNFLVNDDSTAFSIQKMLDSDSSVLKKMRFVALPYSEIWARDYGPIFAVRNGQLAVADFNFNYYGYAADTSEAEILEQTDEKIAALEGFWPKSPDSKTPGLSLLQTSLCHEGGNHESNGRGTLLLTKAVEMQRNPSFSIEKIESELRKMTGATNIVWLENGVREDDLTSVGANDFLENGRLKKGFTLLTTGGHIDEFCRFVNDSTVVLAEVDSVDLASGDPLALENHRRLTANFLILKAARLENGRPFRIVRIPMPPTLTREIKAGDWVFDGVLQTLKGAKKPLPKGHFTGIVAASYCNFLISNGIVIGQRYWKNGQPDVFRQRDEKAEKVLKSVFPDRKVVLIDAIAINLGGGGVHCISQQEPDLDCEK